MNQDGGGGSEGGTKLLALTGDTERGMDSHGAKNAKTNICRIDDLRDHKRSNKSVSELSALPLNR